jgi:hypothetical protein
VRLRPWSHRQIGNSDFGAKILAFAPALSAQRAINGLDMLAAPVVRPPFDALVAAAMHLDVGPYRLDLPSVATIPSASEVPVPHRVVPLARIYPWELNAGLMEDSLAHWREAVTWITKGSAQFREISVNGIPGLLLPPVPDAQRLDYTFVAPPHPRIEIVAWSDTPTTQEQREVVDTIVQTLRVRTPEFVFAGVRKRVL